MNLTVTVTVTSLQDGIGGDGSYSRYVPTQPKTPTKWTTRSIVPKYGQLQFSVMLVILHMTTVHHRNNQPGPLAIGTPYDVALPIRIGSYHQVERHYGTTDLYSRATMSLSVLKYPAVRWAAGGWSFFIAENVLLSENRTWLIEELGDAQYHMVYGTLSTVATASIGYAYYSIRTMTVSPALALKPSPFAILGGWMFLSMGTIMASQTAPKMQIPLALVTNSTNSSTTNGSSSTSKSLQVRCPFDFSDKNTVGDSSLHVQGMERITRHPGLWSFGFVGLGQAMLATALPQQIWWCGPAAIALLGGSHTDSRFRRGMGGTLPPEYECQTSNIPFWAIASGKQGSNAWQGMVEDIKPLNALLAVAVTSLWVVRHVR